MKTTLTLLALMIPGLAIAKCPAGQDLVFSCTTELGGSLNICQADQHVALTHVEDGKFVVEVSVANAQFKWKRSGNEYNAFETQTELTFETDKIEYSITIHEIKGDSTSNTADIVYLTRGEKMKFIHCLPAKPKFDHRKIKVPQSR